MHDLRFARAIETRRAIADHNGVHERQRGGQPEYLYYIVYDFDVNGKTLHGPDERSFADRTSVEVIADKPVRTPFYDLLVWQCS